MNHQLSPLRLPVRTVSGQKLGNVVDLEIMADSHTVFAYHVKLSRMLPDMVQSPLIIRPSQVVEINEKEMVVDDNAANQPASSPAPLAT